jgi:hypothetical protein
VIIETRVCHKLSGFILAFLLYLFGSTPILTLRI